MTDAFWSFAGSQVPVGGDVDRIPDFDPRTGDHLWVVTPMFVVHAPKVVNDPSYQPLLDADSLLYITPVFCYYCERAVTIGLTRRRCPGRPTQGGT